MFTLIVTALAVITVLGFLVRIADSVLIDSATTSPRRGAVSDRRRAPSALRASVHPRGLS
jgi:hypothetical protein